MDLSQFDRHKSPLILHVPIHKSFKYNKYWSKIMPDVLSNHSMNYSVITGVEEFITSPVKDNWKDFYYTSSQLTKLIQFFSSNKEYPLILFFDDINFPGLGRLIEHIEDNCERDNILIVGMSHNEFIDDYILTLVDYVFFIGNLQQEYIFSTKCIYSPFIWDKYFIRSDVYSNNEYMFEKQNVVSIYGIYEPSINLLHTSIPKNLPLFKNSLVSNAYSDKIIINAGLSLQEAQYLLLEAFTFEKSVALHRDYLRLLEKHSTDYSIEMFLFNDIKDLINNRGNLNYIYFCNNDLLNFFNINFGGRNFNLLQRIIK